MIKFSPKTLKLVQALLLGAIFPLGFAPEHWVPLSAFALAGWFYLLYQASSRTQSFLLGLAFGVSWFFIGLQWTVNTMVEHGQLPWWLAQLGCFALALVLALSPALSAWLLGPGQRRSALRFFLALAGLFTVTERLRGEVMAQFDWLNPAYMTMGTPLAGWIPIVGEYGVLLVSLAVVALLTGALFPGRVGARLIALTVGTTLLIGGMALEQPGWCESRSPIPVEVIQPNLPVVDAFTRADPADRMRAVLALRESLGPHIPAAFSLIPEGIINEPFDRLSPRAQQGVEALAKQSAPIFLNGFRREGKHLFNTTVLFDARGAQYLLDKRRLVPFGEYVPEGAHWFVNLLGIPLSDLQPGSPIQPLAEIGQDKVGLLICYETLFGSVVRSLWHRGEGDQWVGPNVLATTANLGWFGQRINAQYLQINQLRAKEVARPMVVASNTGLSAVISASGKVLDVFPMSERHVELLAVPTAAGEPTLFVQLGYWPALLFAILLGIQGFFTRKDTMSLALR